MTITRVGIVGGGLRAQAFARGLARAEITAVISQDGWTGDSGGCERITTIKAAAEEDAVFLSACWTELTETLSLIADWEGRILIDATNPMLRANEPASVGNKTSSEIVRELSPGAQLVKAFNALPPAALSAEPRADGGKRVIFLSGDHQRAKIEVSRLVEQMGFFGIDLGGLVSGGKLMQFPDGPLWGQELVRFVL